MKKIIILAITLTFIAGPVFAATLTPDSTKATSGAILNVTGSVANITDFMKFSKGVYAGAQTSILGYALTTGHIQGSKSFGTGYDATALYTKDAGGTLGATLAAPTSSVSADAFPSGTWTKL